MSLSTVSNGASNLPLTFAEMVTLWLCNNQSAISFVNDILFIAARWDDLIDKDTPLLDSDIHQLMEVTLSLPCNAFYMQHFHALHTLLHNAIRNWKVANALERDPDHDETDLIHAFVLRSTYVDLIAHCAMLIAGNTWGEHVAHVARRNIAKEGFAAYCKDLTREREVRHGMHE